VFSCLVRLVVNFSVWGVEFVMVVFVLVKIFGFVFVGMVIRGCSENFLCW